MRETIFSTIFRINENFKNFVSRIEYHYEISLIQKFMNGRFILKHNFWEFIKGYFVELFLGLTGAKDGKTINLPKHNPGKPKVVHFIAWLRNVGGASKMIFEIINNLNDKYSFEVITLSDFNPRWFPNLKIRKINKPTKMVEYLERTNPDIIHAYYYGDWAGYHKNFEAILSSKLRSKIIMNLLVPIHIYRSERIDSYIYCSKYIRNIQHKKFKDEKVIYLGLNTNKFKPIKNKKFNNAVGMMYRLSNDKIDQNTIELFIEIVKKRPQTKIYIIGDGVNFHHYVSRARQERVRANFIFTGTISFEEVSEYYDKFDVFLAPVHKESYGIVAPYAMAKNMPVVAYRIGALPELLGKTNILVNTAPEMVKEAINLINNWDKAKKVAKGGRERVLKYFSVNKMINEYDKLYINLLFKLK